MSEDTTAVPAAEPAAEPTQEPAETLGENGVKALQAEREARKAAEKAVADLNAKLQGFEDAKLSDIERANKAAADAAAELATLRTENARSKVALEKGVPADLIEFLTGDTAEDMAAKADVLMARLSSPGVPKPDPSQGGSGQAHALNGDPLLDALKNSLGIG
jgi:colicin import membrane protein